MTLFLLAVLLLVLWRLSKKWGAKNVFGYALSVGILGAACFLIAFLFCAVSGFRWLVPLFLVVFLFIALPWFIWQARTKGQEGK